MDTWQLHQKKICYKYLKILNCSKAQAVNELHKLSDELSIKPGQKLCHDCFNVSNSAYSTHLNLTPVDPNELEDSYHDRDVNIESLNEGNAMLGCSPLNFRKISERDVAYDCSTASKRNGYISRSFGENSLFN